MITTQNGSSPHMRRTRQRGRMKEQTQNEKIFLQKDENLKEEFIIEADNNKEKPQQISKTCNRNKRARKRTKINEDLDNHTEDSEKCYSESEFHVDDPPNKVIIIEKERIEDKFAVISTDCKTIDLFDPMFSFKPIVGTYFCIRKGRPFHFRSSIKWDLRNEEMTLMKAKSHGFTGRSIYIGTNAGVHIKSKHFLFEMKTNIRKDSYLMKQENSEIFSATFSSDYGDEIGPRQIEVKTPTNTYRSKKPKHTSNGEWTLPFSGRFVIVSSKNIILLNENNNKCLTIRKVAKDTLELSILRPLSLNMVFGLSIADFLYKE